MIKNREIKTGWRQLAAALLLTPLLAFCGSGPESAAATAAAQENRPEETTVSNASSSAPATIVINEVLAHTDEPQVDAIELYNPTPTPVDLVDWCLSDAQDQPDKFCFKKSTVIPAGGYLFYTANDFSFGLSEFGEDIYLYAPSGAGRQQIDHVAFGVSPNGVSMGRYVNSTGAVHFPLQSQVTLGAANSGPLLSGAVISELMVQPAQGPEYLVIRNTGNQLVPLYDPAQLRNRWQIAGIGNNNGDYKLPEPITLQPGESIVLSADPAAFAATYPQSRLRVFGPFPGKLDNEGERIALQAPQPPETNGDVAYADLDVVEYGQAAPWPVGIGEGKPLLRIDLRGYGNDPSNWWTGVDTTTLQPVLMLPYLVR